MCITRFEDCYMCVGGGVYVILSENNDFMSGCFSVLSENVEHTSEYKDGQTKQRKNGKKTNNAGQNTTQSCWTKYYTIVLDKILHNRAGENTTQSCWKKYYTIVLDKILHNRAGQNTTQSCWTKYYTIVLDKIFSSMIV
jgi:hypothetical protein